MLISFTAHSHQGRVRHDNQDSYLALPGKGFFAVSDGMGGQQNGALASALVVESLKNQSERLPAYISRDYGVPSDGEFEAIQEWFAQSFDMANSLIKMGAANKEEYRTMGATLTALYLDGLSVTVGHLGDSRAYQWRRGELFQLTNDHNLASEMEAQGLLESNEIESSPHANVLTKAICAVSEPSSPSLYIGTFEPGDVFLICSDGLYRPVTDEQILNVLEQDGPLPDMARELISLANTAGGPDNITVLLIRVEDAFVEEEFDETYEEPPQNN